MTRIEITQLTFEELMNAIREVLKQELPIVLKAHLKPQEAEVFLTRNEVSDILRISLSTLYNYTKLRILKSYRLGSRVLYKKSEVLKFMEK